VSFLSNTKIHENKVKVESSSFHNHPSSSSSSNHGQLRKRCPKTNGNNNNNPATVKLNGNGDDMGEDCVCSKSNHNQETELPQQLDVFRDLGFLLFFHLELDLKELID